MLSELPYEVVNQVPMTTWTLFGAKLHLVHTMHEWQAFYELLEQQTLVACDTETDGFEWFAGKKIVGMSFGWRDMHFYIPVRHLDSLIGGTVPGQLDMDVIREDLRKFFSDKSRTTIWHNYKFDAHMYSADGIRVQCIVHDTTLLWNLVDENAPKALKIIASGWKDELGRKVPGLVGEEANAKEIEIDAWRAKESKARRDAFRKMVMQEADIREKQIAYQGMKRNELKKHIATTVLNNHPFAVSGKDVIHYGYIPIGLMTEYAALDTYLTFKLYEHCVKTIKWTSNITSLYKNELVVMKALFTAEEHGVRIDRDGLIKAGAAYDDKIAALRSTLSTELGDINLASTIQLSEALMENDVELTKMSDSSTDENPRYALDKKVLKKLSTKYVVVKDILALRENSKLKTTYVEGISNKLTSDNILHCSFNQNVRTGRMSSQNPNLQNIPGKDKTIRKTFVSWSDEYDYILADYSQIEVRLTAHYSQDPVLLDAYAKGQDIHTRTFCEMFGHDLANANLILNDEAHELFEEFTQFRKVAKVLNFGIIYGVSAAGLSEQIERPSRYYDLTDEEWVSVCESFIASYFAKYAGVKRFINQASRKVAQNAEVTNYFGRVRHLPHANATKILGRGYYWLEMRAQRQGCNYLIQSTAADLFKVAVARIYKILEGSKSTLVNLVHDEIHVYLHKDDRHLLPRIKNAMEDWKFTVPIIADFSIANPSWGSKIKLNVEEYAK